MTIIIACAAWTLGYLAHWAIVKWGDRAVYVVLGAIVTIVGAFVARVLISNWLQGFSP